MISYLQDRFQGPSAAEILQTDPYIRAGRVIKVNYPDKTQNDLVAVTYDVLVDYQNDGGVTTLTYYKCHVNDIFGGAADFLRFRLRPVKNKLEYDPFDVGSTVLVVGIGGNCRDAVIIGGLPHPKAPLELDDGIVFKSSMNGINIEIDGDGQLSLLVSGKTDDEGINTQIIGSQIQFDKDKNITITNYGKTKIDSLGGIYLGGKRAIEPLVKGATWRANESLLHANLVAQLSVLGTQIAAAATALGLAAAANAVSGTAALPLFGTVVAALAACDAPIVTIVGAIQAYEAQANNQLSGKNFTE